MQLGFVQTVVEWAAPHKLFMAAGRYNFSFIHNHDGISCHHCSEPMSHDEAGPTRRKSPKSLTDLSLAVRIDTTRSLIEYQYLRIAQNRPGDAESLSLTARQKDFAPLRSAQCHSLPAAAR